MRVVIVGGGIGGCTLALMLKRAGISCVVREAAADIRPLGVGINTLPHSIQQLADLGLLPALDEVAIRTSRLTYANHRGQVIWSERRGVSGGHKVPQFSIHRGALQQILWRAVEAQSGGEEILADRRLIGFAQTDARVEATFEARDGRRYHETGDVLVGADGIHSSVRAMLHPDAPGISWNGIAMWRGATLWTAFEGGDAMIVAGNARTKLVLYPIGRGENPDTRLTNWVVYTKVADPMVSVPPRESWSKRGSLRDVEPLLEGFDLPSVDVRALIAATPEIFEFPMCDKDPLPWWTSGRVTLLGDAAHPMYPVGSNGSAQAILDARCLCDLLATREVGPALQAYDDERRPRTADIVASNRKGGPERIIDVIAARAPDGFARLEDVATREEIDAIAAGYATLAGFARDPTTPRSPTPAALAQQS